MNNHFHSQQLLYQLLPPNAAAYSLTIATELGCSPNMVAVIMLGLIVTATLGVFQIKVSPTWIEPSSTFFAVGGPSGSGKSPALKRLQAYLDDSIAKFVEVSSAERERREVASDLVKDQIKELKRKARKVSCKGERNIFRDQILTLNQELKELRIPVSPIMGRVTTHALPRELALRNGSAAILDSEGGIFPEIELSAFGQMTSFLNCWSEDKIDHTSKKHGTITVPSPRLTTCILWQPTPLATFLRTAKNIANGLAARILPYFTDKEYACNQRMYSTPQPGDGNWWKEKVNSVVVFCSKRIDSGRIPVPLSTEADQLFQEYRAKTRADMLPGGQFQTFSDVLAKSPSQALRIALSLELLNCDHLSQLRITGPAMQNAIALAQIFVSQHIQIRQEMETEQVRKNANRLIQSFRRNVGMVFTPTMYQLSNIYRPLGMKKADCEQAMFLLMGIGLVVQAPPHHYQGTGRPRTQPWTVVLDPRSTPLFPE